MAGCCFIGHKKCPEEIRIPLLENIKNLQNKTCFIVTHRPGALEIADKVLNVENGKIV